MNTTIEYLEAIKTKTGLTSDYQLAKVLDCSRAAVSLYRKGQFLSDEMCLKVADILEIDPAFVLLSIHAERTKSTETKRILDGILQRLGGVAATLLIATGLGFANPSPANAGAVHAASDAAESMYIMLNNGKARRRKKSKIKPKIDLSFLIGNMLQPA